MKSRYMQVVADQAYVRLDPRTKILVLLIINLSAFAVKEWYVMALMALIPLSLLILSGRYYTCAYMTLFFSTSLFLYIYLIDSSWAWLNIIVAMLTGVMNRMGPGLLMGYYLLSTTTVSEFIAGMEKLYIPKQIIIPLSVMFRFFPTIKEESTSITDAMRMRGIQFGKSRVGILTLFEYRLIPLFISCIKIGEELSCSALTRGLGSPNKRTNICKIGFTYLDIIYVGFSLTLFMMFIL